MGLGNAQQGGGVGGSPIRVGGVGDYPPYGKGPGKFPVQVFQADYGGAAKVMGVWGLVIPAPAYSNVGGGVLGDGRICTE